MSKGGSTIRSLVGSKLNEFKVEEMHEVYHKDDDGKKSKSVGFFRRKDLAEAYAATMPDAHWFGVDMVFVLTNGNESYAIDVSRPVALMNEDEALAEVRRKVSAKLSPPERKILGIDE